MFKDIEEYTLYQASFGEIDQAIIQISKINHQKSLIDLVLLYDLPARDYIHYKKIPYAQFRKLKPLKRVRFRLDKGRICYWIDDLPGGYGHLIWYQYEDILAKKELSPITMICHESALLQGDYHYEW